MGTVMKLIGKYHILISNCKKIMKIKLKGEQTM